jgi:hypothetical protein
MYQVIFKNKEIKEINDAQGISLLNDWSNGKDKFILGGALVNFSFVADIRPVKSEESNYPQLPEYKATPWTKNKRLNALRQIREGFLRGVSNAKNLSQFQQLFVENIDKRIDETIKAKQEKFAPITTASNLGFNL